ncbi:MAG: hypothetical protein IKC26_09920 [Clostridia bacterium]|nr:hypothetical protein [Clostridia bacterium]MBR2908338.1 hypothetical protein [Clostridia bacterium]
MKITVNAKHSLGKYVDPTAWQNSTLRYTPPEDFPAFLETRVGRAKIMRTWITLDEYWDYKTGRFYPDYDIGVARYKPEELHYVYDWANIVPAPSGTRFEAYLTSHAKCADELLLNVRRLEREVSDGVITYEQYEEIFEKAVDYCKSLAPNIRYIECCNEVDGKSFGNLTPEEYVKIYLAAHRAVKRLNARNNYDIPLEIGGYAAAKTLARWDMIDKVLRLLRESEIGDCPMDFYSYHLYNRSFSVDLFTQNRGEIASLGGVGKLRKIMELHNALLDEIGLPVKPVFLNELGRASTTGIDGDSIYNACGILTYLIAFGSEGLDNLYPFPWCTFHNPKLQMSFTQYLLNEDGSYSATPNGHAIEMLHSLSGDRLALEITEASGPDAEFRAIAAQDGDGSIAVVCVNPTAEVDESSITVTGLPDGTYRFDSYKCTPRDNNVVTGKGTGALELTASKTHTSKDGVLFHYAILPNTSFALYRITKID